MPGIFPDLQNGAVVIRDINGVCQDPFNAINYYCPPASFTTSCTVTALPEDCTARVAPSQVNAIVSELTCLAASIDPNGSWDCGELCNLAQAFTNWAVDSTAVGDGVTISVLQPFGILPIGVAEAICDSDLARATLAQCLISGTAGNLLQFQDGRLYVTVSVDTSRFEADGWGLSGNGSIASPLTFTEPPAAHTAEGLCSDPVASAILAACVASGICADSDATETLAACLISGQAGNVLHTGTDGKLYSTGAVVSDANWQGPPLSVAHGGTGVTTLAQLATNMGFSLAGTGSDGVALFPTMADGRRLKIQWGSGTTVTNGSGDGTIFYHQAFTTNNNMVLAMNGDTSVHVAAVINAFAPASNGVSFNFHAANAAAGGAAIANQNIRVNWIAIGW